MRREAATLIVLALGACTTIREEMPTTASSAPPPAAIPIVVVPVPVPVPVPGGPVPAPADPGSPNTTPTPAPSAPPPSGGGGSCSLPASHDNGCSRTDPSFLGDVEAAIDTVTRTQPSLFNLGHTQGCGTCYEVLNPGRYVEAVASAVRARGLCSLFDGEELAVKNSNSFSDQYDILTAQNFIRRQGGSYRATCRPAAF